MKKLDNSQYRLRKTIAILGIALPIFLLLSHYNLLSSMSHYYYTSGGVFFIGILVAFGLVLVTYQGYPKSAKEILSDEAITTIAAICIFITVLVPTKSSGAMGFIHFKDDSQYLFGHNMDIKGTVHLVSAGLFLILLGWMCYGKFTLGIQTPKSKKILYKFCGLTIWGSIAVLLILFIIDIYFLNDTLNCYFPAYTFWVETIAVWAFGLAWLVKGRFDRDIHSILNKKDKTS